MASALRTTRKLSVRYYFRRYTTMTKSLYVNPDEMRRPGTISFADIPVNSYQKTVADEKSNFSKTEFMNIYRDMCVIREFETMLNLIKTTSEYQGISYTHPG